jgi:nitric oxide reductase NorE protein
VFFTTYLFYRGREPELFNQSQALLDVGIGVLNTVLLLTSSLAVVTGVRAIRRGEQAFARPLFALAFLCGAGFGFAKYVEYSAKIVIGITPGTNNFFMYYYILTGLHMFHVLVGMGVLVFMWAQAGKPVMTSRRFGYIEGGGCYWHMVDLLWVVLFPLLYLVRT